MEFKDEVHEFHKMFYEFKQNKKYSKYFEDCLFADKGGWYFSRDLDYGMHILRSGSMIGDLWMGGNCRSVILKRLHVRWREDKWKKFTDKERKDLEDMASINANRIWVVSCDYERGKEIDKNFLW